MIHRQSKENKADYTGIGIAGQKFPAGVSTNYNSTELAIAGYHLVALS